MIRKPTVLIVDDDAEFREACASLLIESGFSVELAEDGRKALACRDASQPDIIVLDMILPGMDGLEVLDRLPRRHGRPVIPVVAASGLDEFERPSLARGAGAFLRKPLAAEDLITTVGAVLEGARIDPRTLRAEVRRRPRHRRATDSRARRRSVRSRPSANLVLPIGVA